MIQDNENMIATQDVELGGGKRASRRPVLPVQSATQPTTSQPSADGETVNIQPPSAVTPDEYQEPVQPAPEIAPARVPLAPELNPTAADAISSAPAPQQTNAAIAPAPGAQVVARAPWGNLRFRFSDQVTTDELLFSNGEYARKFVRAEELFAAFSEEESVMLENSPFFVSVMVTAPQNNAPQNNAPPTA